MTLPDRLVALPDVTCPACWEDHRVNGSVSAIVTEDGAELYRRCACGFAFDAGAAIQPDLFGVTA